MLVVLLVYGLLNLYLFRTAAVAYPTFSVFFATVISLLVLCLLLAVRLEKSGKLALSLPFAWIGYSWLGISGIALCLCLASDLLQWILPRFSNQTQFHFVTSVTLALSLFAAIEAKRFRIRTLRIHSAKLSSLDKPLRVVQFSDLHLGDSSSLAHTKRVVAAINALTPDLVVSTGDLFDGYLELMAPFVDALRQIEAPLGKFAVSGNHEVYAGLEQAVSLTQLAGFQPLRNEHQILAETLCVAGVEDPASPLHPDEAAALQEIPSSAFIILLKHRPAFDPHSQGRFDLQLSGHTHGGQVAPFHLLTKIQYKAKVGLSTLAPNQQLYLSRGIGAWGPQLRLFAPPEVTLFELSE